jgi:hypothetical protein
MEVTREFKPETLRSDEIVELLYSLLHDDVAHVGVGQFVAVSLTCFPTPAE